MFNKKSALNFRITCITFTILFTIIFISCNRGEEQNGSVLSSALHKTPKHNTSKNSDDVKSILKDSTFFCITTSNYHYRNVRYYFYDIGLSPYYSQLLVKESDDIKLSRVSEGQTNIITLEMLMDMDNGQKKIKTFTKTCDNIELYPHYIECMTIYGPGDWEHIELYNYNNFSKPFIKCDQEYWYFNMNSDNQHVSKNCFFVTYNKFQNGHIGIFKLSDMQETLQEVLINVKNLQDTNMDFAVASPDIMFSSENPYQYNYNLNHSSVCNTINISPKGNLKLRNYITKSVFTLVFYDTESRKDSVSIPIQDGLLFNKPDKQFNVTIFN